MDGITVALDLDDHIFKNGRKRRERERERERKRSRILLSRFLTVRNFQRPTSRIKDEIPRFVENDFPL